MKIHAIVNRRAGTVLHLDEEQITKVVGEAFSHKGHEVRVDCVEPDALHDAIKAASQEDIDVLVVGGGDGSIRTAANQVAGTKIALGILPLGTMNRLARDLSIPLRFDQAAEALASGSIGQIDVADVNGKIFLCNSLMGIPPKYAAQRQQMRGRPVHQRVAGYASTIKRLLHRNKKITIAINDGQEMHALSVAVTNNGYDETASFLLRRSVLDGGKLTMYVSRHANGWAMAKAVARALLGRWNGDPDLTKITAKSFVIKARKDQVQLANDGEVEWHSTPLRYKVRPSALKVILPAASPLS